MKKSETITEISKALVEFQGKLVKVKKDGKNPHFGNKYASLSQIIEAIQIPLNECGLSVIQLPMGENELETMLLHQSGEWIAESYIMKPQRNDPQGVGSAITYQRRYALGAMLCLNIEEDDDANTASETVKDERQKWSKPPRTDEPVKIKKPLPPERFDKLISLIKQAKVQKEVYDLINNARETFTLTDDQQSTLEDWILETVNMQS